MFINSSLVYLIWFVYDIYKVNWICIRYNVFYVLLMLVKGWRNYFIRCLRELYGFFSIILIFFKGIFYEGIGKYKNI